MKNNWKRLAVVLMTFVMSVMITVSANAAAIVNTGDSNGKTIGIIAAVVAALGLGTGIVVPRIRK